jgi:hypothetical protein
MNTRSLIPALLVSALGLLLVAAMLVQVREWFELVASVIR